MTYEEFCAGVGVTDEEKTDAAAAMPAYAIYERCNVVYMEYSCFLTKQDFYHFYMQHGFHRVHAMYMQYMDFLADRPNSRIDKLEFYQGLSLKCEVLERELARLQARLGNAALMCGIQQA